MKRTVKIPSPNHEGTSGHGAEGAPEPTLLDPSELPAGAKNRQPHEVLVALRRALGLSWAEAVHGLPIALSTAQHYPLRPWWDGLYSHFADLRLRGELLPELKQQLFESLSHVLKASMRPGALTGPDQIDTTLLLGAWDRAAFLTGAYALARPRHSDPADEKQVKELLAKIFRVSVRVRSADSSIPSCPSRAILSKLNAAAR